MLGNQHTSYGSSEPVESEFDGDQHQSGAMIISAKALKTWMKSIGFKMSSNAYEALNQFISQFLICLVSESCKAMQSDQVNFAGQSPTFGPVNVSWSYIIMAIKAVAPSIEPWFSTWYKQLSEHVNIAHSNDLPGEMPCCREMAERCNLIVMDECERIIRLGTPPTRTFNWFAVVAISCTLNEIVQWVLKVSSKVLQTKGLATLRRTELSAIISKAPIFEQAHKYIQELQERPILLTSPKQIESKAGTSKSQESYYKSTPRQNFHQQIRPPSQTVEYGIGSLHEQTLNQAGKNLAAVLYDTTSISVDDLYKMYEDNMKYNQVLRPEQADTVHFNYPTYANVSCSGNPFGESFNNISVDVGPAANKDFKSVPGHKTRYIVCPDQMAPWMKVKNCSEELLFVTSTGVETDEIYAKSSKYQTTAIGTENVKMASMQEEIDSLKNLLMKVLGSQKPTPIN